VSKLILDEHSNQSSLDVVKSDAHAFFIPSSSENKISSLNGTSCFVKNNFVRANNTSLRLSKLMLLVKLVLGPVQPSLLANRNVAIRYITKSKFLGKAQFKLNEKLC